MCVRRHAARGACCLCRVSTRRGNAERPCPAAPPAGALGDPSVPPALDPNGAQVAVQGATGTVQNTHTMEEVGMAIEAAIAAAAALPANGDDTCAISYRGLEAMLAEVQRAMPDQPTNPLPLRDQYLEVCRDMPQEVQQCLLISHAIEHQEECERVTANLDPALRARVEVMMASGGAPAP
jgi:hypothetical protein